jgi:hypothetical protein
MVITKEHLSRCSMLELRALAYTYTDMSIVVLYKFKRHELIQFLKERDIESLLRDKNERTRKTAS